MQKKPQKNPVQKQKSPIVDQQNEPFLRTIFKRVRNINKKLLQIVDLKKKQDLKPEQIEKINRKAEYEQERTRLEGIADFFRQVYGQNLEHYKNNQLQELDSIAQAVAVLRGNANFKEADKLSDLNRVISEPSNENLVDSTKNISEVLRRFATDYKLKNSLAKFVTENPTVKTQQPVAVEVKPVVEVKVEEPKKVEPVVVAVQPEPVKQQVVEVPVAQVTTVVETPVEVVAQQPTEEGAKTQQRKPRGQYRGRGRNNNRNYQPREPRGEGQTGQRKPYKPRTDDRKRPNYKPKESTTQVENDDSDSSLEREPEFRNFKKEELKELDKDGFIVVGKPSKPKAQAYEQKKWHDHTHGQKHHHGHHKENN